MTTLRIENLYSGYSGVDILQGLTLSVTTGEFVAIIGPNGAGKSTVLKSLFGLAQIRQGKVLWGELDITYLRSDQLVRQGICYVPQTQNVFPRLTIQENLEIGAYSRSGHCRRQLDLIYQRFPDLKLKRNHRAGCLSGGQRQMLAIGRALMVEPKLLLLDEPTAGLSPLYVNQMFQMIKDIQQLGVSLLMVEQKARQVLALADRGYVLVMGTQRFEDTGPRLLRNPHIANMFLGG